MADKTMPCKFCKAETRMLGTGMCDNCWEVRCRVGDMHSETLKAILLDAFGAREVDRWNDIIVMAKLVGAPDA